MKWIGAFFLVMATTLIGFHISNRLEKRPKHIRQLQSALQLLEAEITYSQTALKTAFATIAIQLPPPVQQFFHNLSKEMEEEQTTDFLMIWNHCLDELAKLASYKRNEIDILRQFGSSLGRHNFLQQQKQIKLALTHLDRELEEARDEQNRYSKLAKSLGILFGVFLVVLLI